MLVFIGQAVSFVQKNWRYIIAALVIIMFLFMIKQCNDNKRLKSQLEVATHNLEAATDTIRVTKDREGRVEYDKLSFLMSELKELKKANKELYDELKATKGEVAQISKIGVKVIHDTVPLVVKGEFIDSTVTANFSFDTTYSPGNFRSLKGFTKYDLRSGKTLGELTSDKIGIKFITGIKGLDENKPEIFVRSNYPGFEVIELEGAVIDKNLFKKSKTPLVTLGVSIGWNPMSYDFSNKKVEFSATKVGAVIGANFNIGKFFKK